MDTEVGVGDRPSNALSYAWEYLVAPSQSYLRKSNMVAERWPWMEGLHLANVIKPVEDVPE